jgi:hypothetical protein
MAAFVRRLYRNRRTLVRETRPDGLIAPAPIRSKSGRHTVSPAWPPRARYSRSTTCGHGCQWSWAATPEVTPIDMALW